MKSYKKDSNISYTYGVYPTLELLKYRKNNVERIILHSKGNENEGIDKIKGICDKQGIKIEINDKIIESLRLENTYALGIFKKYETKLDQNTNHILLVNPSDMGNLGTIIRTMLAFNIKNLAVIKPSVDIFSPKVIRASMGEIFQMNIELFNNLEEYAVIHKNNLYPFLTNGKTNLIDAKLQQPFTLIFGNEGEGLDQKYLEIGESIKIEQSDNIDSLNLSIAVGIGIFIASNRS